MPFCILAVPNCLFVHFLYTWIFYHWPFLKPQKTTTNVILCVHFCIHQSCDCIKSWYFLNHESWSHIQCLLFQNCQWEKAWNVLFVNRQPSTCINTFISCHFWWQKQGVGLQKNQAIMTLSDYSDLVSKQLTDYTFSRHRFKMNTVAFILSCFSGHMGNVSPILILLLGLFWSAPASEGNVSLAAKWPITS